MVKKYDLVYFMLLLVVFSILLFDGIECNAFCGNNIYCSGSGCKKSVVEEGDFLFFNTLSDNSLLLFLGQNLFSHTFLLNLNNEKMGNTKSDYIFILFEKAFVKGLLKTSKLGRILNDFKL